MNSFQETHPHRTASNLFGTVFGALVLALGIAGATAAAPAERSAPPRLSDVEPPQAAPVIDEELVQKAILAPDGAELELVVWLAERPGSHIAREVREEHLPAVRRLAEDVRGVQRSLRPAEPYSPSEEESLRQTLGGAFLPLSSEQRRLVDDRSREIDERLGVMRREIHRRAATAAEPSQARLAGQVTALGGQVLTELPVENVAVVRLPADQLQLLARAPGIARIEESVVPMPLLDLNAPFLGVPTSFWPDQIDGFVWDVGILDSCLEEGHPNHAHVEFLSSGHCDGTDWWNNGHGTQVTGIVASNHTTHRGLAFGIHRMLIGNMAHAMSDADWMLGGGASDDAEVINGSFGVGANPADYTEFEQFFDGLVDDRRVMIASSAGNQGQDGALTLTEPSRAFNTLSVANVFADDFAARDEHVIAATSARGPTPGGRKKPDIAAPGDGTRTTTPDGELGAFGGTSAAAPHVAAGLVLLTELRGSDEPTALKAVLIQTADAWTDGGTLEDTDDDGPVTGSHWNATYGWGYLDLWEAWFNGLDVFTDLVDDGVTPAGRDFKLYKGRMYAGEKATLVWNRHVGSSGSNFPSGVEELSDLDLVAYREWDGIYITGSFSGQNNVEQIDVDTSEDVILKVEVYETLDPNVPIESYSLATEENFVRVDPPTFSFTSSNPFFTPAGSPRTFTVTVTNDGDVTAFLNSVTLNLPSGFTLLSGSNPRFFTQIAPGATVTVSWVIRWDACTPSGGTATIGFSNSSSSYGETLKSSGFRTVACENLNL